MGTQDGFPITELHNLTSAETLLQIPDSLGQLFNPGPLHFKANPQMRRRLGFHTPCFSLHSSQAHYQSN